MRIEQTQKRYAKSGHILYSCEYHIVWCTKYRRGVLTQPIQNRLKSLIYEKQNDYKYEAIEIEVMPDHVHLLAGIDPHESAGHVVSRIKGWTSNHLRIKAKADTIVIGDLKGIRNRAKFSKKSNQKVHQWAFARLQAMIAYKAELAGLKVKFVSEAYTSQTCPKCGNRKKPTNRNYKCKCGFAYHRDGVGAINLWNKVSGFILSPVVGAMASPIGVRFHEHLCKSG